MEQICFVSKGLNKNKSSILVIQKKKEIAAVTGNI